MGEPPDRLVETKATASGAETVEQVVSHQSRFWTSLHPREFEQGEVFPSEELRSSDSQSGRP
jgi:hypothetical protein